MLTSKERGDHVAKEFLGTTHTERETLAELVRQEIEEAVAAALAERDAEKG